MEIDNGLARAKRLKSIVLCLFGFVMLDGTICAQIIIDNSDYPTGFNQTENTWISSNEGKGGHLNENFLLVGSDELSAAARWTPEIPTDEYYEIFMKWSALDDRSNNVPVEIHAAGHSYFTTVNQQLRLVEDDWYSLGVHFLEEGEGNYVRVTSASSGYTVADAVKFTPYEPIEIENNKQLLVDDYAIDRSLTAAFRGIGAVEKFVGSVLDPNESNFETRTGYFGTAYRYGEQLRLLYSGVIGGRGNAEVSNNGTLLERVPVPIVIDDSSPALLPDGSPQQVNLFSKSENNWQNSTALEGFWGPRYTWTSDSNASARWTPFFRQTGYYEVYLRWTAAENRSEGVVVEIDSSGVIIDALLVDQTLNGGSWQYLGRYKFRKDVIPAASGVTIRGASDGVVVADAVKFVYCGSQNSTDNCNPRPDDPGHHGISDTHHWLNGVHVFEDIYESNPLRRYKALHGMSRPSIGGPGQIYYSYSPDGNYWWPGAGGGIVIERPSDSFSQIMFDPVTQTYRAYVRARGAGAGKGTTVLINDDFNDNPADWEETGKEWNFHPIDNREIYTFSVWYYEGIYFGFTRVYENPIEGNIPCTEIEINTRHEEDVLTAHLLTSRNGMDWDFYFAETDQQLISRGGEGAFDNDMVNIFSAPLTYDTKHILFYGGANERHQVSFATCEGPSMKIGKAELPLDRWGKRYNGITTTKPFILRGNQLSLNVDAEMFTIQLLAAKDGTVLIESDSLSGNGLDVRPTWQNIDDLGAYDGQLVRFRFIIPQGDLWTFRVIDESIVNVQEQFTKQEDKFRVYPNPMRDVLNIEVSGDLTPMDIEIFDLKGTKIRTLAHHNDPLLRSIRWNGKDDQGVATPPGVYFCNIIQAGSSYTGKVIKIR